jgi:hypothetical protein
LNDFITINLVLLGFFALIFLWGRNRSKEPSQLKVTASAKKPPAKGPLAPTSSSDNREALSEDPRDLTTQFMYNGHNWEAYEVLGLAKGSTMEQVKAAFELSLQKTNPNSHEFLKTALSVILTDFKNRGYKP